MSTAASTPLLLTGRCHRPRPYAATRSAKGRHAPGCGVHPWDAGRRDATTDPARAALIPAGEGRAGAQRSPGAHPASLEEVTPAIGHRRGREVTPDRRMRLTPTMTSERRYIERGPSLGAATLLYSTRRAAPRMLFVS